MHRLAALLLLAACAAPAPAPVETFRDAAVPIASSTRVAPQALLGDWTVVAAFAPDPACPALWRIEPGPSDETLTFTRCGAAEVLRIARYGRFEGPAAPLWILWIAEDGGTAVVGTPSGVSGAILNRGAAIRPDRLTAARAVLAFNGYDLGRLTRLIGQTP